MESIVKRIRDLHRDQSGVSAIEFAIIGSSTIALLSGAYDLGNAAQQQIALQEAVRTGGQYAVHFPTNPSAIQAAVKSALPAGWNLSTSTGNPVVTCSCGVAGAYNDCANPPSNCTSPMLVTITAQMAYTALTPIGAVLPANLTATYVTRFQ